MGLDPAVRLECVYPDIHLIVRSLKYSCCPFWVLTMNNHVALKGLLHSTQSKVYCWIRNSNLTYFPTHNLTVKGKHWESQSDTVNSHQLMYQGKISSIWESLNFYKIIFFAQGVIETEKLFWMCHACPCRMFAFQFIAICTEVIVFRLLDHHCCSTFCAATGADKYPFPKVKNEYAICL